MTHVAAREVAAAVAVAAFFDRALVENPFRRLDRNVSAPGYGRAVTGDARGDDAVEHVDSAGDALGHLAHDPKPHHVARLVLGQVRNRSVDRLIHEILGLADRDPAHGIAVEAYLHKFFGAVAAQVVVDAALHDPENELSVGVRLVLGALRPAQSLRYRFFGALALARIGQAFVEDHRDVGAEYALHGHRLLGTEEEFVAVQMGVEAAAVFRYLAHLGQREDLKSAAVGENGAIPAHELVKAAGRRDHFRAGP